LLVPSTFFDWELWFPPPSKFSCFNPGLSLGILLSLLFRVQPSFTEFVCADFSILLYSGRNFPFSSFLELFRAVGFPGVVLPLPPNLLFFFSRRFSGAPFFFLGPPPAGSSHSDVSSPSPRVLRAGAVLPPAAAPIWFHLRSPLGFSLSVFDLFLFPPSSPSGEQPLSGWSFRTRVCPCVRRLFGRLFPHDNHLRFLWGLSWTFPRDHHTPSFEIVVLYFPVLPDFFQLRTAHFPFPHPKKRGTVSAGFQILPLAAHLSLFCFFPFFIVFCVPFDMPLPPLAFCWALVVVCFQFLFLSAS